MTDSKIGIEKFSFYVPRHYIDLATLAEHHGIDPAKFSRGIGQDKIAMPTHDEDIVTLAAEAAKPILDAVGDEAIDTLIFATETSIDQSKAAGVYVHKLLGMKPAVRVVEMKHACYSGTAALQMALGHVSRKPDAKVLVITSDVARYDLDSSGEPTQGAGAVAMLVSADPKIMAIDHMSGIFSEDIMDFWRPNYRKTPLVDGKYSALRYLNSLSEAWADYQSNGGRAYEDIARFCYHLPFSRMGVKAHHKLSSLNGTKPQAEAINDGFVYNRAVGNCYTASLYLSLISTLENCEEDLAGKAIALFSYGSGAVSEFFTGEVQPGYREHLNTARHAALIEDRTGIDYDEYLRLWHAPDPRDGETVETAVEARGVYRLARIDDHKRCYEAK